MKRFLFTIICCSFIIVVASNLIVIAQPLSNNEYAIANLEAEIKRNKGDKSAYMGLCYYYSIEKQYYKLYAIMEKINKTFKNDENALNAFNQYSKDFLASGNYDVAEKISKITLKTYNKDAMSALIHSEILARKYNFQTAIKFLKSFLAVTDKKQLIYDSLISYAAFDRNFNQAFELTKEIQKNNLSDIYYYFYEALFLQPIDTNESIKYLQAYLDKLAFTSDAEERIVAAKLILSTLKKPTISSQDYVSLIKRLKNINAPDYCLLVESYMAHQKFPDNKYFLECLQALYKDRQYIYKE